MQDILQRRDLNAWNSEFGKKSLKSLECPSEKKVIILAFIVQLLAFFR
jgi:hypothetical protein